MIHDIMAKGDNETSNGRGTDLAFCHFPQGRLEKGQLSSFDQRTITATCEHERWKGNSEKVIMQGLTSSPSKPLKFPDFKRYSF